MKFNGYICDICGCLAYNSDKRLEVKEVDPLVTRNMDLCRVCADKMIQWIKDNKPDGDIRDKVVVSSEEEDYENYES